MTSFSAPCTNHPAVLHMLKYISFGIFERKLLLQQTFRKPRDDFFEDSAVTD